MFQETVVEFTVFAVHLLSPCTFSDGTQASRSALMPRSCQATGQIYSCCYRESTFHHTLQCIYRMDRFHASTTSLRVSSSRNRFLPVCLTSSNLSSPFRNLWNHLCTVRTGTHFSPNASMRFFAISEAIFPSLYS